MDVELERHNLSGGMSRPEAPIEDLPVGRDFDLADVAKLSALTGYGFAIMVASGVGENLRAIKKVGSQVYHVISGRLNLEVNER